MRRTVWLLGGALCAAVIAAACTRFLLRSEAVIPSDSLGMVLIDIADDQAASSYHVEEEGIYVLAVEKQGQAAQAGVTSGDRLVRVNGRTVANTDEYTALLEYFLPNENVLIDFYRRSTAQTLSASFVWNETQQQ